MCVLVVVRVSPLVQHSMLGITNEIMVPVRAVYIYLLFFQAPFPTATRCNRPDVTVVKANHNAETHLCGKRAPWCAQYSRADVRYDLQSGLKWCGIAGGVDRMHLYTCIFFLNIYIV